MIQGKNLVKIIIDTNDSITPAAKKAAGDYLAALHEAGGKMAKIYTHLPKEIRNESNVYYQILLSGVEAMELMTALEAWEAANK